MRHLSTIVAKTAAAWAPWVGILAILPACRLLDPRPPEYDPFVLPSGVGVQDVAIPWHDHLLFARPGDGLTLHYVARLVDGELIDSSWDAGAPLVFELGDGSVPLGLEQGLVGMRQFAKRRLTVPPDLAYGAEGVPGLVPPDATVLFDLELLEVRRPEPAPGSEPEPEPSRTAADGTCDDA